MDTQTTFKFLKHLNDISKELSNINKNLDKINKSFENFINLHKAETSGPKTNIDDLDFSLSGQIIKKVDEKLEFNKLELKDLEIEDVLYHNRFKKLISYQPEIGETYLSNCLPMKDIYNNLDFVDLKYCIRATKEEEIWYWKQYNSRNKEKE